MEESVSSSAYNYGYAAPCNKQMSWNCSDRFIPSRITSNLSSGYTLLDTARPQNVPIDASRDEATAAYKQLLHGELLGHPHRRADDENLKTPESKTLFSYQASPHRGCDDKFSLSQVQFQSRNLSTPGNVLRKIPKMPFKVLDAPQLHDDFYLNLVDWSSTNSLAVGLSSNVYLWSACTSRVTKLCDLVHENVTSVSWMRRGTHIAVGTSKGEVQIWDAVKSQKVCVKGGHTSRVGAMAWNGYCLSTGSRDQSILQRDIRSQDNFSAKLDGHRQEVCGLKWSYNEQQLASGGNDNKLFIWNLRSRQPVMVFSDHQAAVKAITWSPHQHGLLASGGGTADRCIRFWNTVNNTALSCVDTGSQVCNLIWSKNVNEIVSTHGYSLNQIIIWKYPTMSKVTTLTGHTYRVLYLAMSPDGQTIVTGAGDETLRFWTVFPSVKAQAGSGLSADDLPLRCTIR